MAPRLSTGEFSYVLSSGWYHERTVEYGSSPYDSFRGLPEHCPERKGALADARSGEKRGCRATGPTKGLTGACDCAMNCA